MQIRVANRQDEKHIQALFAEICRKKGEELDLGGSHKDLRNIEANYFGNEGLFLIAEVEGQIVGFAGARKKSDETISIDRFFVGDTHKRSGVDQQFMQVIVPFAQRMFFNRMDWNVMETPPAIPGAQVSVSSSPSCFNKALLVKMRFKRDEKNNYWLPITPCEK